MTALYFGQWWGMRPGKPTRWDHQKNISKTILKKGFLNNSKKGFIGVPK